MLRVLYFARLREALGTSEEHIDLPEPERTVESLLNHLRARGERWQGALAPTQLYRVAVNQELVDSMAVLKAGDEVAIFPPVTGG